MTLSPVFRSPKAVQLLAEKGIWSQLALDIEAQADAVRAVHRDFEGVIGAGFRKPANPAPADWTVTTPKGLEFVQEYFFLILFRSIFRSLGVEEGRLQAYSELNFCIKGTITAADNLFDDQSKTLLPLAQNAGSRFMSILQLMAFERLTRSVLDRAVSVSIIEEGAVLIIQRALMDRMAEIGVLEGSEEGGVEDIPTPEEMVTRVHRVRGGSLFALAFAAPSVLEEGALKIRMNVAEEAIARLGTAFQIVDDLTDFEFDVGRRSHNLLVAQVHHSGTDKERMALERIWKDGYCRDGTVEDTFASSARQVLERAYIEARASFSSLEGLGYWFDPALADEVVHAIVGLEGVARMQALSGV
ncbi:polyprenyl synthetase family protein [Gemmatimonadales bacterium]|jgi:hypothetical protein|nr:polyprenyl synthetase family protein [Gemmatimonadales bacterium]